MSWWSAAFSALGSAFSSRSSRKQNKEQADMYRRMQEMELAQQRNLAQYQRQNDLEDRRYRQEAIGNYRTFNKTPGLLSPEYSDTTPSQVALPQGVPPDERPTNHNQGLMFFR